MLLGILSSCKPPTIKKPVEMYAINTAFFEAGTAKVNLNIRSKEDTVGEWVTEIKFVPLNEAPENMMCFSEEIWLTLIRPKLKEGNAYYKDHK